MSCICLHTFTGCAMWLTGRVPAPSQLSQVSQPHATPQMIHHAPTAAVCCSRNPDQVATLDEQCNMLIGLK